MDFPMRDNLFLQIVEVVQILPNKSQYYQYYQKYFQTWDFGFWIYFEFCRKIVNEFNKFFSQS